MFFKRKYLIINELSFDFFEKSFFPLKEFSYNFVIIDDIYIHISFHYFKKEDIFKIRIFVESKKTDVFNEKNA